MSLGCDFCEDHACRLAQLLHAEGLMVIDDIVHISRLSIDPYRFGFGTMDVQMLEMVKSDANSFTRRRMLECQERFNKSAAHQQPNVIHAHVPFYMSKWMSLLSKVDDLFNDNVQLIRGTRALKHVNNDKCVDRVGYGKDFNVGCVRHRRNQTIRE